MKPQIKSKKPAPKRDATSVFISRKLHHHLRVISAQQSLHEAVTIRDIVERTVTAGLKALKLPEYPQA